MAAVITQSGLAAPGADSVGGLFNQVQQLQQERHGHRNDQVLQDRFDPADAVDLRAARPFHQGLCQAACAALAASR